MWQIDNRTPFAAAGTWVRDSDGGEIWIVAVKASFSIVAGGALVVAAKQAPVLLGPQHHGEPGRSSLLAESDLIREKNTTDVVLNGHAHAPAGRSVAEMEVRLRVGAVDKRLHVFGDRQWRLGRPGPAAPFLQMPIIYERAFGGVAPLAAPPHWDARNPLGTGFAVTSERLEQTPPPNVEYPGELIRSWKDRPRPAGFGAVEAHWPPRAKWAGSYDERWSATRFPLQPDDFDERHFQCAPDDQQTPAFLVGGESVALQGLSDQGDLAFHLPRCVFSFETRFYRGAPRRHTGRLHTVLIEPDLPRISLTFQTALRCYQEGDLLERTVVSCNWTELAAHLRDSPSTDRGELSARAG